MKHIIYHGSPNIIFRPEYGTGNVQNDFGQGLYCTKSLNMAKEWAVENGRNGYANCFEIEDDGLKCLDLLDGNYHVLNWLAVLLDNRAFRIDSETKAASEKYIRDIFLPKYEDCDLIYGYRSDDSYFSFANSFLNNAMTVEKLTELMQLGEQGEQFVVRSQKAFEKIQFLHADKADGVKYYSQRKSHDEKAREREKKIRDNIKEGTFLVDIIREEWRNDDGRLQRMLHI